MIIQLDAFGVLRGFLSAHDGGDLTFLEMKRPALSSRRPLIAVRAARFNASSTLPMSSFLVICHPKFVQV